MDTINFWSRIKYFHDFFSSARNYQKSSYIMRSSKKWSILWDFLVGMEFDWCFQFCSKLPETARNVKNLQKVIDFVGFPGIDGIRSMCHFCSKLSEIASNVKNLEEVIDFVGFPGIDGIWSMCQFCSKLSEMLRISKKWSILWDFLV